MPYRQAVVVTVTHPPPIDGGTRVAVMIGLRERVKWVDATIREPIICH